MKDAYKAEYGSDGKFYPAGPDRGGEFGYYSGTLCPQFRFETEAEAANVARMMSLAYANGYKAAQFEIRKALGIEKAG